MDKTKISIVGAGQVGSETTRLLTKKHPGRYVLVDKGEGIAQGKALDIRNINELGLREADLVGTEDFSAIADSDIVVITAGYPRKKGMSREDLLSINLEVISDICRKIQSYAPEAIIVTVTNPLDAMTYAAWRISGFSPNRVMGMAGALDRSRFAYFIAQEAGVSPADVSAQVLGTHGDQMVPLISNTSIAGIPAQSLLTAAQQRRAIYRTVHAGTELVNLLQTGSAYFAASNAIAAVVEAIITDSRKILNCSVLARDEYGLEDVYIGLPVVLGLNGVEKIIDLNITDQEYERLQGAAAYLKDIQLKIEDSLLTTNKYFEMRE